MILLGPKLRQQPGPGPAGSWAGPAWFKMLLGLGGNQGGGGGEGKRGGMPYQFSQKNTHFYGILEFLGKTCKSYRSVKSHIWHFFEKK